MNDLRHEYATDHDTITSSYLEDLTTKVIQSLNRRERSNPLLQQACSLRQLQPQALLGRDPSTSPQIDRTSFLTLSIIVVLQRGYLHHYLLFTHSNQPNISRTIQQYNIKHRTIGTQASHITMREIFDDDRTMTCQALDAQATIQDARVAPDAVGRDRMGRGSSFGEVWTLLKARNATEEFERVGG